MLYATRGLVETLLRMGDERDPESTTISLAVTNAEEIPEADLDPETPIFTHFYLPNAGGSVNAVFGVDLGTPVGQTQGRFVSHPRGELRLTKRDDFHEVIFIAVPPWTDDDIAVFDRTGTEQDLTILDIEPPQETAP